MKLTRGVETRHFRGRLTLESADGDSHSAMCNFADEFNLIVDELAYGAMLKARDILTEKLNERDNKARGVDGTPPARV